jgi:hypothetical protein
MIRYLEQDKINRSKWDMCIEESINGMIYAKSWFLDVVAEEWDALVENNYERIFPLVRRKKWGIEYLYQPVFTQQLGLFSKTLLTEKSVGEFLDAIPSKFRFAEINLNTFNKVPAGKYKTTAWVTHELDLIKSYNALRSSYSTNLKRNLARAEKEGLTLNKNIKPDDVIRLFRENRGRSLKRLGDEAYLKLSRLSYSGIYKGLIQTYGIYSKRNDLVAGAIFLQSKKKMIFLFSGLNAEGRETGAMAFLIDQFIREHQHKHLTLDFEGSNDPNLARFYKSFGSARITYPHLEMNRLNPLTGMMLNIRKRFRP